MEIPNLESKLKKGWFDLKIKGWKHPKEAKLIVFPKNSDLKPNSIFTFKVEMSTSDKKEFVKENPGYKVSDSLFFTLITDFGQIIYAKVPMWNSEIHEEYFEFVIDNR